MTDGLLSVDREELLNREIGREGNRDREKERERVGTVLSSSTFI